MRVCAESGSFLSRALCIDPQRKSGLSDVVDYDDERVIYPSERSFVELGKDEEKSE